MTPRVANNKPKPVDLKAGQEYYFCTCGKSAKQPLCDGTHTQVPDDQIGEEFALDSPADPRAMPAPEEHTVAFIHQLATEGLSKPGHHGPMSAMGRSTQVPTRL